MYTKYGLMAVSAAALFAAPASAVTTFYSTFETNPGNPNAGTFVIVPSADGWTGNPNIELQNRVAGSPATPPPGDGGDVFVELDTTGNSEMFRDIDAGVYNLSYFYSPRPNNPFDSNGIQVFLGSSLISQISAVGLGTTSWSQINLSTFTVGSTTRLTFRANGTSDSLGGYVDNILLAQAVPEPSTWAMFILGFGALGFAMRRRNAKVTSAKAALRFA